MPSSCRNHSLVIINVRSYYKYPEAVTLSLSVLQNNIFLFPSVITLSKIQTSPCPVSEYVHLGYIDASHGCARISSIMANLVRSAKSGNDWTSNDLAAYNITVHRQSAETFFGYTPNTIPNAVDPAFITAMVPPNENLSDNTYRLLQYLDLATRTHYGQESAIHDFSKELLHLLGFEER